MKDRKQKLEHLKVKNEKLKPVVFVGFDTEQKLLEYRETIVDERKEYYDNLKEIERLEWELLTPKEQEQYLEEERISILKREGKL